MSIRLDYKDEVTIVETEINEYNSESIKSENIVPALFLQKTGFSHGSNQESITSDATVYVDPTNDFVISNFNRLEGMLLKANLFDSPESITWYRIASVEVAQDKLLCNDIDNIYLSLNKSTEIHYAN